MKEGQKEGRRRRQHKLIVLGLVFRTRFSKTLAAELTPRVEEMASRERCKTATYSGWSEFNFV